MSLSGKAQPLRARRFCRGATHADYMHYVCAEGAVRGCYGGGMCVLVFRSVANGGL